MSRSDEHRPSVIEPSEYQFVAFSYLRVDGIGDSMFLRMQRETLNKHMERTGDSYSGHEHGGTCHVCGSVNAIYTAVFHHPKSRTYIKTGLDCAEKLGCYEAEAFRRKVTSALDATKGKRKAKAVLEQAGIMQAYGVFAAAPADSDRREEATIRDIVGRLVQYGNISENQMNYLRKLEAAIAERPERDAQRAAEAAAAAPVPVTDKRVTVKGTVLSVRDPGRDEFGPARMLVQHADGWKVWGSVPSAIASDVERGAVVQFDAMVKISDRDPKFGFFSRPTKVKLSK